MIILARRKLLSGLGLSLFPLGCSGDPEPNEPGAPVPGFALEDFQPQSARFGEVYGAEEFSGSVLLLPLFASWCPDCVGCAYFLEQRYAEWQQEGLNVRVMSVNKSDATGSQHKLIEACSFPLLQDTEQARVWEAMQGERDDHYIYRADGILDRFYDYDAGQRVDPQSHVGREELRQALLAAGA